MNAIRNKVQLIGNLASTPEVRTIDDNKKVAMLVIVTKENYKNAKGEKTNDLIKLCKNNLESFSGVIWGGISSIL